MMLMKLLHTTNTLSEAKDQPHRYKVRAGGLPTFGNATEPAVRSFGGASAARANEVAPALHETIAAELAHLQAVWPQGLPTGTQPEPQACIPSAHPPFIMSCEHSTAQSRPTTK